MLYSGACVDLSCRCCYPDRPLRQTSGQCENVNPSSTGRSQYFAAFVHRASGCKDVINKEYSFADHPVRGAKVEDFFEIGSSQFPGEERLGEGGATAKQQVVDNPVLPLWKASSGNNQRLIKPSLAQPAYVERNRYDQIRFSKQWHDLRLGR